MALIRILIIEPALDTADFLQEALAEVQEGAVQGSWIAFESTCVPNLEDALEFGAAEPSDLILLSSKAHDGRPLDAVCLLRSRLPDVPIVAILNRNEESIAPHLIRAGAEDYAVLEDIECIPLGRAISNAIERHKVTNALLRVVAFDEITGLFNERAFDPTAVRDAELASRCGASILLVLAELDTPPGDTGFHAFWQRDLALVTLADAFAEGDRPGALLACLEGRQLVALTWNRDPEVFISRVQARLEAEPRDFAVRFGWARSEPAAHIDLPALLEEASSRLCENELSYPYAHS